MGFLVASQELQESRGGAPSDAPLQWGRAALFLETLAKWEFDAVVPEVPSKVIDLDLMKRLKAYSKGPDSWSASIPGQKAKQSCERLHADILSVTDTVGELLDKIGAREMESFTLHDRRHALKVAHLMWHILTDERRQTLTPPEIAFLIYSAFLHDLGMFLSPERRNELLEPESSLWRHLGAGDELRDSFKTVRSDVDSTDESEAEYKNARQVLLRLEDTLLSRYLRDHHAEENRIEEVLADIGAMHQRSPSQVPDLDACLSYDGQSLRSMLVRICVSHVQDAAILNDREPSDQRNALFPSSYPVGGENADVRLVAAALRLADILDFDRGRTPEILYRHFLPQGDGPENNRSVLEWQKHLAISNWTIDGTRLVFRGRCKNHVVHHAIVLFCKEIEREIRDTRSTLSAMDLSIKCPFSVPDRVEEEIVAEGYTYIPYRFELDDERIYQLLMGGAIYPEPLDAVRELVQNAVDACLLRDHIVECYHSDVTPTHDDRIIITYVEPTEDCDDPKLIVEDTGTGMDAYIIETYFLKVGQSYYASAEFSRFRAHLRSKSTRGDFAPVSEFGIGFLSTMLLADRVVVETAMWDQMRENSDTRKRTMEIHGPTRLIHYTEEPNEGSDRMRGTRITLSLVRGVCENDCQRPPTFAEIEAYLRRVCISLPYPLCLRLQKHDGIVGDRIEPAGMEVAVPPNLEEFVAARIPLPSTGGHFEGEIVILDSFRIGLRNHSLAKNLPVRLAQPRGLRDSRGWPRHLLRGGFTLGDPPGLPMLLPGSPVDSLAIISLQPEGPAERMPLPGLSRDRVADEHRIAQEVARIWVSHFLMHQDEISGTAIAGLNRPAVPAGTGYNFVEVSNWIEEFDASSVFEFCAKGWRAALKYQHGLADGAIERWREGEGPALPIGWYHTQILFESLLLLILPRICRRVFAPRGKHLVTPPKRGWSEELKNCKHYVRDNVSWGRFASYGGSYRDIAYIPRLGALNDRFESEILSVFGNEVLGDVVKLFDTLAAPYSHRPSQSVITPTQLEMFRTAREKIGHLHIGFDEKAIRIEEIPMPTSVEPSSAPG